MCVVVALSLALACTQDGDPVRFADGFARASEAFRRSTEDVKDAGRRALGGGADGLLGAYEAMRASVVEAHDDFASLEPPASVRTEHGRLVGVLQRQGDVLDEVISAARSERGDDLNESLAELARLLGEFSKVHASIERRLERRGSGGT